MGVAVIGAGCARERAPRDVVLESESEGASFIDQGQPGIGVRLVPVRDTKPTVASVLGPYETNPVPADPTLLYRWRRAGLRIIAVPVGEVDALVASLTSAGAGDERWWTEVPNWSPIAAGPWGADRTLSTGSGVAAVGPGRTRLLARAWFEPWIGDSGVEATVRVELVPQRERPREDRTLSGLEAPAKPGGAPDAGPVLAELALTVRARGGDAYVIVGASPDADWSGGSGGGAGSAIGPDVPRALSVGESMLADPGSVDKGEGSVRVRTPTRVLIVLRPNIPQPVAPEGDGS